MRLRCLVFAAAAPLLQPSTLSLTAQQPVRVLRHSPADTARPGDIITIAFDRPVVGSLDRTPDPGRLVRITPAIDARIQWRDPTTLRVVPRVPLTPGQRYTVTVSNEFIAVDGGRLESPYQFAIATKGPRILAMVPGLHTAFAQRLEPSGRLQLVYSAPIDTSAFVARVELTARRTGCTARDIRYTVRSQRAITDTDDWELRVAGGWDRDSVENSFRRVVEIRPVAALPEGCDGEIALPSLDPADRAEIRYRVMTAPTFALERFLCAHTDCGAADQFRVGFGGPVHRDSLLRYLRLEPAVRFTIPASEAPLWEWAIGLRISPRTTYRIRLDPALTDGFGRPITGTREASIAVGDRTPALGHQLGFFTVSRTRPMLRLTHVNVDSVALAIVPVPDSLRVVILDPATDGDSVARMVGRLRDTVRHRAAVPSRFNIERITEIPIPPHVLANSSASLFAIRAAAVGRMTDSGTPAVQVRGRQPAIEIRRPRAIEIFGDDYGPSRQVAIVQLTDLIAHAKVSDNGGSVLVTDGSSGRPVSGARVLTRDARDRVIAAGETDGTGVALLTPVGPRDRTPRSGTQTDAYASYGLHRGDTRIVEVVRGSDRSLTSTASRSWARSDVVDRLGGSLYDARLVHASVFTDRGIYRPGETIYLTAIVRRGSLADLRAPDRGDSVRVRVTSTPPGERERRIVRDTVLRLTEFGTAADSFSLGPQLPLGDFHVLVDASGREWNPAGHAAFRLAEYRAPEFEASLVVDSAVRFLGDTLTAHAGARYYFGAPMSGATVRWHAVTSDARGEVTIPALAGGFVIGESYRGGPPRYDGSETVDGVDTLDASGKLTLRIPTPAGATTAPARVDVDIAVDDLNRQSVSARKSAVLHASSFYVAARDSGAGGWYWSENRQRRLELLAVRPDGKRVSGVRIGVAAVRHRVSFTARGDGSMSDAKWTTDTILRDSTRSRDGIVRYSFTPHTAGWHELIFSATDERGRTLRTSVGRYVLGRGWTSWADNPLRVAMLVDADSVAPGDTLDVRFVSPFARAEAWVTVEREAVLSQRRLAVGPGATTVRIPVTRAFIPSVQVSVLLVDSGSAWRTDSTHRRFRAGYASVAVNSSSKTLSVDVKPDKSRYAPGDSARVTVSVRDHRAAPAAAQVTLWAVDEGVLALADYERPNPLEAIHSAHGTALQFSSTATSMASLGRFLTPPGWLEIRHLAAARALSSMSAVYGTPATNSAIVISTVPRTDFRSTAFYVASLVTAPNGAATASVKLPDNLTTYRVIAVAVTAGDAYGSGESSIMTAKPLIARPSLPRFLRTGDAMLAGAVINNTTADSIVATVRVAGAGVMLGGDTVATQGLKANGGREARFHWHANSPPGDTARFRITVEGGTHSDAVETSIPMRPPYAPRYHAVSGVARGRSTIRMMLPGGIDPHRSRLTLRVGTSPVPIVRAAYAQVEVYPYACSEQLTSTGQVIMSLLRLQRVGVLDSSAAPDARTLRGRLQFIIDELARRQSYFGGIRYWPSIPETDRWLSAYAGTLLIDARDAGFQVDSAVIARLVKFVQFEPDTASVVPGTEYGTRKERERIVAWSLAQDLAVLHFRRRAGAADTDREQRLRSVTSRMVWEDRVWLAELLAGRPDKSAARSELALVWRDVELAGTRVDIPDSLLQTLGFRSHVRPVARLLRATVAIEPDHPRMAALIERVVQQGRATRDWLWNTQDYAEMSSALADVAALQRNTRASTITVRSARGAAKGRPLLTRSGATEADSAIPLDGLLERDGEWMALPIQVESDGGPTFYALTVDEVPLTPPTTPDAQGMIVERWFERFDDGRPVTDVTEGDLVRGRLRITVPADREFVAVEDLLPAGLEVVDLTLRTTSLGPFESETSRAAEAAGNRAASGKTSLSWLYGSWRGGWWSPWEHEEKRDDRVMYFARVLWKGTYTASYVARATTAGTFVRPPAHAEEMYNRSVSGRSEGGTFRVLPKQ